jgi:hypothetical protein
MQRIADRRADGRHILVVQRDTNGTPAIAGAGISKLTQPTSGRNIQDLDLGHGRGSSSGNYLLGEQTAVLR